jgi:hypothetical protein
MYGWPVACTTQFYWLSQEAGSLRNETQRVQHRVAKLQAHQQKLLLSKSAQESLYAEVCHTLNAKEIEVGLLGALQEFIIAQQLQRRTREHDESMASMDRLQRQADVLRAELADERSSKANLQDMYSKV